MVILTVNVWSNTHPVKNHYDTTQNSLYPLYSAGLCFNCQLLWGEKKSIDRIVLYWFKHLCMLFNIHLPVVIVAFKVIQQKAEIISVVLQHSSSLLPNMKKTWDSLRVRSWSRTSYCQILDHINLAQMIPIKFKCFDTAISAITFVFVPTTTTTYSSALH